MVSLLTLWKIGKHDLQEWDESRNGVNAFEMIHNHDCINYYYDNKIDTWNAKPPLMIWLIVFSYKTFGYNEFALRFPSFVSTIIFFVFCYKIIELLSNQIKAQYCCLILMSCKAVFGNHIGLTGDFDMLLVALLTASVYYFILFFEKQQKHAIYLVAVFTGLAFYAKGAASLIFLPGFIAYLLIRNKGIEMIKDRRVWISIFVYLLIVASWVFLVYSFGKSSEHSFYGSKNSIETMLIYDAFKRLTSTEFAFFNDHDSLFFFKAIDNRLNIWSYIFYFGIIIGLYELYKFRKKIKLLFKNNSNRLTLLSICIILPLAIILTIAINQHNWYLAPTFMFIVFLIVQTIDYIKEKFKYFYYIIIILFCFTFIRNLEYIYSLPQNTHNALSANRNLEGKDIIAISELKQNIYLYLKWLNTNIIQLYATDNLESYKGQIILFNKNKINNTLLGKIVPLYYFDEYCLARIKN